jgi:hypothetical protein
MSGLIWRMRCWLYYARNEVAYQAAVVWWRWKTRGRPREEITLGYALDAFMFWPGQLIGATGSAFGNADFVTRLVLVDRVRGVLVCVREAAA